MQGMLAGGELVAFLDDERAVGNIEVVDCANICAAFAVQTSLASG